MMLHAIIFIICLIIATGCLGAGYALAGYWLVVPVLLVLGFFWIMMRKHPVSWLATSFLLAYVILAAMGIISNISSILMIIACAAALACWDLMRFNQSNLDNSLQKAGGTLEKHHLFSLALAISAGLIVAFISTYINLQFPFGVIVVLVLILIGSLLFSMHYIINKQP